jgi:hypothetical protein
VLDDFGRCLLLRGRQFPLGTCPAPTTIPNHPRLLSPLQIWLSLEVGFKFGFFPPSLSLAFEFFFARIDLGCFSPWCHGRYAPPTPWRRRQPAATDFNFQILAFTTASIQAQFSHAPACRFRVEINVSCTLLFCVSFVDFCCSLLISLDLLGHVGNVFSCAIVY